MQIKRAGWNRWCGILAAPAAVAALAWTATFAAPQVGRTPVAKRTVCQAPAAATATRKAAGRAGGAAPACHGPAASCPMAKTKPAGCPECTADSAKSAHAACPHHNGAKATVGTPGAKQAAACPHHAGTKAPAAAGSAGAVKPATCPHHSGAQAPATHVAPKPSDKAAPATTPHHGGACPMHPKQ